MLKSVNLAKTIFGWKKKIKKEKKKKKALLTL